MAKVILVLNAGSSSIKFRVFDAHEREPRLLMVGQVDGLYVAARFKVWDHEGNQIGQKAWSNGGNVGHQAAVETIAQFLRDHSAGHELAAVGHRVVHGGQHCREAQRVTPALLEQLQALSPLAPLHQPNNLAPIHILRQARPNLLQVACFDTAFHRSQPEMAQAYALPHSITSRGVRRYGFHGLSYEFIASLLPTAAPEAAAGKTVAAHLGNGSSLCAMAGGSSVASTMGFTALDGLPMGTRCGSIDPGVILYLMDEMSMTPREIETLLYRHSGLLGVSGISSDMRVLLESEDEGARFAVALYCYRIAREIGSLAAAMQGLDALVFTAGIGEHAPLVREQVCKASRWLGLELDEAANRASSSRISKPGSKVSAWVLPTNEELMIARHTRRLMGERP